MVSTTVLVRKRKIVVVVAPGDPRAVASEGVTEVSREIRPVDGRRSSLGHASGR